MKTGAWQCAGVGLLLATSGFAQVFEKPVRIKAAGEYIKTEVGHSAPYMYDFDGDGVRDLLVGQFGGGKLRIYRNKGTAGQPDYEEVRWFKTAGEIATVPAS